MAVLVYADSEENKLAKTSYEIVAYGKKIADQLGTNLVTVVGGECANVADLGAYGAEKVLHAANSALNNQDPKLLAHIVAEAASKEGADVIVMSHDYTGKGLAPRIAAKLEAGLVTGAVDYPDTSAGFTVKKAVFSGKAFAHVDIKTDKKIISLLPNSVEKTETGGTANVEAFDVSLPDSGITVKEVKKASTELSLTEADLVVSAGRGLKGPENWGMIEDLAHELGAATACSRPVADVGWRPHHEHVGQTGIAIRPNLYIAIGISGAIQHLAGVNGSKVIVVINTDDEAPFFKAADYGIVGDAFEVVPRLIESVKKFKAANN